MYHDAVSGCVLLPSIFVHPVPQRVGQAREPIPAHKQLGLLSVGYHPVLVLFGGRPAILRVLLSVVSNPLPLPLPLCSGFTVEACFEGDGSECAFYKAWLQYTLEASQKKLLPHQLG